MNVGSQSTGRLAAFPGRSLWFFSLCSLCLCGSTSSAADKKITYDEHVLPLLREKCAACHGPDRKSGGLRLHTFANLMAGGGSGAAVKPGDPDNSPLFLVTAHKREPFMPPKSPRLDDATLETLRKWIEAGAPENAGSKATPANKPKYEIALSSVNKGKPDGPPPMPSEKLGLDPVVRTARPNAVTALASSPWAPLVAVGGQKQVLLYHSDTGDLLGVLPFPEGTPHVLKFSRNGALLLAGGGRGGKSGRVVVFSVTTGERVIEVGEEFDAVLAADISADQTMIALGGPSKVVRVYSTKDGKLLHEIKKHTDWIYSVEYSPDGVLLATGDRNGGLFVWEAHTAREYFTLRAHTAAITDLSWRADGNVLASASEDTTIRLWEMENGGNIKGWGAHGGGVLSVQYAKDGRLVSCGRDRVPKIWDGNGGQQRAFEALPDVALRVAFSHDAARVVAGDWTGQIRVWNAADGKALASLAANPQPVAERLQALTQEVTAKQAEVDRLTKSLAESQPAAQKLAAELAEVRQRSADLAVAAKIVTEAVPRAKAPADQANAALAAAQAQVTAKDALAKTLAEAAAKLKAAADQAKDNKEIAALAAQGQQQAAKAAAELAAAQKAATDQANATRAANEALAATQRAAGTTGTLAAAAAKEAEVKGPPAKAMADRAAAEKAALDKVAAELTAAKAQLERLRAAATTRTAAK
jgi:hypothetical protein